MEILATKFFIIREVSLLFSRVEYSMEILATKFFIIREVSLLFSRVEYSMEILATKFFIIKRGFISLLVGLNILWKS
jgi:hypothetical protein